MEHVEMLRMTIELVPFGQEEAKVTLATMVIGNDASGDMHTGNYLVELSCDKDGKRTGSIRNFPRRRLHAVHLVATALKQLGYDQA